MPWGVCSAKEDLYMNTSLQRFALRVAALALAACAVAEPVVAPQENIDVKSVCAPCITRIKNNSFFITFWCYEDWVSVIRWRRLHMS